MRPGLVVHPEAGLRGPFLPEPLVERQPAGGRRQRLRPAIGMAIEAIESADFLSLEQKRDILYQTAARFLRLSEEEIVRPHRR